MEYIFWLMQYIWRNIPKSIHAIFFKIKEWVYNVSWYIKYRITYTATMNVDSETAIFILKGLWWFRNTKNIPVGLIYNEQYDSQLLNKWHNIIRQIRFAFFYYLFILNDFIFYIPFSSKDKEYYKKYIRKKYWYVKDFLTDSYFNYLMPDSIFEYIYNKEKNKYIHLPTQTTISRSDYITLFSNSDNLPVYDFIQEPLENYYKKGMELFIQFFEFLWK
jgi:hypothetical protein